jgi:tryptophan-rich sensory protein
MCERLPLWMIAVRGNPDWEPPDPPPAWVVILVVAVLVGFLVWRLL